MMDDAIRALRGGSDLAYDVMSGVMSEILAGDTGDAQNADFLRCLAAKGETDEELLAMLDAMGEAAVPVCPVRRYRLIDMCGTGGDGLSTLNVSTAASFVAAACGCKVAKHGNRSSTGACGSADIFESLGYDLDLGPAEAARLLKRHGICFMFAPRFHPAMRHVAAARKMIGARTAFNLLGPLSNPACMAGQLVGVSAGIRLDRIPRMLAKRGVKRVMAVRSEDGMDELSACAASSVCMMNDSVITEYVVRPEEFGLRRSPPEGLRVGNMEEAVRAFVRVLEGTANAAMTDTVILNAAGGLIVSGVADRLADAVNIACGAVHCGAAFKVLERFVRDAGDIERLEAIIR